jgi:hypothetical protein
MSTRPIRIGGDLSLMRAIHIHNKNLLVAMANELIESNQLSVRRPRRGASNKRWLRQLHIIRAIRICDVHRPLGFSNEKASLFP